MKRSKLLFLILSVVFILILVWIAFDFSKKTRFPGQKEPTEQVDSVENDNL
jgi:hypothetical protein